MSVIWILVCSVLTLLGYWCYDRKKRFRYFTERGIPGPKPNFLLGNLIEAKDGLSSAIRTWGQRYGKTFGYFEGSLPILVTSDVDILRQVFIKEFHKFAARKQFPVQVNPDEERDVHLFFAAAARWKRQRSVMTKAFSAQRIRQMTPVVQQSVKNMMSILDKHMADNVAYFDIYPVLQCLTLEIIMSICFGVALDAQRDDENIFIRKCRSVFTNNLSNSGKRPIFGLLVAIGIIFPSLREVLYKLQVLFHDHNIDHDAFMWFTDAAGEIINQRRGARGEKADLIQLMLDVELGVESGSDSASSETDEEGLTMTMDPETSKRDTCPMLSTEKRYLTFEEMKANCQLFLLAGYETTSTGLAYIMYELALHQDYQDQLYEEVIQNLPHGEMGSYHTLKKLKYLDMFVMETFRLHPIAPFVIGRTCLEDTVIKGLHIPKGQGIAANVFALQFDGEIWPDPDVFNPERFRREVKSNRDILYHVPFGAGPRNCLGIRFAMHEIRIAVSELVRKYRVLTCEKTEIPLQTSELATIVPKHGIPVTLKYR